MSRIDPIVATITSYSKVIIATVLVLSVVVGAGAPMVEESTAMEDFEPDTTEGEKLDYIGEKFDSDNNVSIAQVIVRDDNVIEKRSLVALLEYQQALHENETVSDTLTAEQSTFAISNLIATVAMRQEQAAQLKQRRVALNTTAQKLRESLLRIRRDPSATIRAEFESVNESVPVSLTNREYQKFRRAAKSVREAESKSQVKQAVRAGTQGVLAERVEALQNERAQLQRSSPPSLDEQIRQLESMEQSEIDAIAGRVLTEDGPRSGQALLLMPTYYEPGSATVNATILIVRHQAGTSIPSPASAPEDIIEAQGAMEAVGDNQQSSVTYTVFGDGILAEEIDASMQDSIILVAPLALLFLVVVLAIAYRDLLDIVLGLSGVALVLLWTFGFMGWLGIAFNQIFILVPVLLIGLSIDYGIHIFMRHREERSASETEGGPRTAMGTALAGVGIALVYVTIATVFGFLSNLTSPATPIRQVGLVSGLGIAATLLVFGVLLPALKIELDEWLESRGVDRQKPAFGTGGGKLSESLGLGKKAAKKAPYLVLTVALLVSVAGGAGAAQIETSFETKDFLADDPDDRLKELPELFAPDDYSAKTTITYLNDNFVRQDTQAQILIEGEITQAETLERVSSGQDLAAEKSVTATSSGGESAITSPITAMRQAAAANQSFNQTFTAADTDGNGVPDQNLEQVYDEFFTVAPDDAASVISRTSDGEYEAMRVVVSVEGAAAGDEVREQMQAVATEMDGGGVTATATGQVIMDHLTQSALADSVIQSLAVSLFAVLLMLTLVFRFTEGSATLGVVTLLPVVFALSWVLGSMYLLDIPINVATGMITSLTIGLGVAYSIHLTERYNQELARTGSMWEALQTSVTGTGGALFGSAATTIGGFGVLTAALLPPLQQLGLLSALSIAYSFVASILVLPSLLVVWMKYAAPDDVREDALEEMHEGSPDEAREVAPDEARDGAVND